MIETVTDSIDVWTAAVVEKSASGRGSSGKISLHGVKKLRELILQLAVMGKLVPQDPNDEPASVLLEKIATEKARLVKEGKNRIEKVIPKPHDQDKNFDIPESWAWERLGNISKFVNGFVFKSEDFVEDGVLICKIGDIQNGILVTDSMSRVRPQVTEGLGNELIVAKGELLIAMSGATTGKLGINTTDKTIYINQRVGKIKLFLALLEYIFIGLELKVEENLSISRGGAIPNLSTKQINEIVIPLPPLAEQHRIVAKVDELMALCDELERQQTDSLTAHELLVETLLGALTRCENADEFGQAWGRIADNFDTLITTESSADKLKETILQLAVMGKLEPQDPSDEPASDLYSKKLLLPEVYERAKKHAIKKAENAIENLPILPNSWKYCSVDFLYKHNHLLDYADGNHGSLYPRKNDFISDGVLFLTAAQISQSGTIDWEACPRLKAEIADQLTKGWSQEGDVYFTHNATVGRTALAVGPPQRKFLLGTSVTFYRINRESIDPKYLHYYFSSLSWYGQAAEVMQQTTRNQVSITKQALFQIALPPIYEQHRIVAKVDELMALCDDLKSKLTDARETQALLADAVVEQATS